MRRTSLLVATLPVLIAIAGSPARAADRPYSITADAKGGAWFAIEKNIQADGRGDWRLGHVTSSGEVSYPSGLLQRNQAAGELAGDTKGNLWASVLLRDSRYVIARMRPGKKTRLWRMPAKRSAFFFPSDLSPDQRGGLWYHQNERRAFKASSEVVGHINRRGRRKVWNLGRGVQVNCLAANTDRHLWIAGYRFSPKLNRIKYHFIGRLDRKGKIKEFRLPGTATVDLCSFGTDGNIWFSAALNNAIGRMTPAGKWDIFTQGLPADSYPGEPVAGSDGRMWFIGGSYLLGGAYLLAVDAGGTIQKIDPGTPQDFSVTNIASGASGDLWLIEQTNAADSGLLIGSIVHLDAQGKRDTIPL